MMLKDRSWGGVVRPGHLGPLTKSFCRTPPPTSLPVICQNGGVANLTECLCPPGYSGPTCETEDVTDRCADGSTAVGNRCICPPGRSGPRCNTSDETTACRNGGTAVGTECYCPSGFYGPQCEYNHTTVVPTSRRTTTSPETPDHPMRSTAAPGSTRRTTTMPISTTAGWWVFCGMDAHVKTPTPVISRRGTPPKASVIQPLHQGGHTVGTRDCFSPCLSVPQKNWWGHGDGAPNWVDLGGGRGVLDIMGGGKGGVQAGKWGGRRPMSPCVLLPTDPCQNGGHWTGVSCVCPPNVEGERCQFGAPTINITAGKGEREPPPHPPHPVPERDTPWDVPISRASHPLSQRAAPLRDDDGTHHQPELLHGHGGRLVYRLSQLRG